MKTKLINSLGSIFGLLLFTAALWVLHQELKTYHLKEILRQLHAVPASRLWLGFFLTVLNYLIMTGYDFLALRYVGYNLSYSKTALASFIGYAFSNNIGLSMIAGASVRYRLYSAWGLSAFDITKIVAFCTFTLWIGFFYLGGLVFLVDPLAIPKTLRLPFASTRLLGIGMLGIVALYLFWSILRQKPLKIREWEFPLPSTTLFLAQAGIASLDWALAGSVLFVLLPPLEHLSWIGFLGIFLLAQLAGLLSQVPGGLGVFETTAFLLLAPLLPASEIMGILLAYRGIYYLLPLGVASLLLGSQELLIRKAKFQSLARLLTQWLSSVVPQILSFMIFIGGAFLLFSGATPAVGSRLAWLKDFIPLPVLELSHFLGSLTGMGLLLLARGLQRRLDAAYVLTGALLVFGIVFSLLKGLDYEEASILAVMLAAFLPCRHHFYRKVSLLSQRFNAAWIGAILIVMASSLWLGFFSYRHLEYSHDLWWRLSFFANAPRFMRAEVGVVSLALFFGLARLLRPAPRKPVIPPQTDLEKVHAIVRASPRTYAGLALLGDKNFLFSSKGQAFIMYGIEGRSWVAMGDPVGPEEEWTELLWRFREMCYQYGQWPVFYQVTPVHLHLYLDMGLTLLKLGEEARVSLPAFSLQGNTRKNLRSTWNKLQKESLVFEIIPSEQVKLLLPDLKTVSDQWLAEKNTREKGFSLGFFAPDYLSRFRLAVVKKENTIIAFANIWEGANKNELSVDLMRYHTSSSLNIMDFLFINLLLWGKQEGYQWFNFGMAPFSGLQEHALGPLWNRLGARVFRYGEHFYNFQGLRHYKEKFQPEWEPRYLACRGGLSLPIVLANVASLISGGLKGVITK